MQATQVRVACTDLAGHRHHLIVFGDEAGLVVVFPPGDWAVLAQQQVEEFRTALVAPDGDNDG